VPYPGGVESRFGNIFPVDHIAACRDRLSQRAQLDQYTTAHNMDDLDELREWLGFETLDLNGGSYGTWEIQVFLRRHPESARTVILDAVAPIFAPGYVAHARGLQNALDELIDECLGNAACAKAFPDIKGSLARVLERVRTDPPQVLIEGKRVPFGPGELGYALRSEIPAMVHAADKGEWQPLASYYLGRSGWVSKEGGEAGMHFSVLCAEDIARESPESIERETAGTFLGDYLIGGYARACEIWPYAKLDPSFWEPVRSDVPALLFSGTRDPVTPPSGGEAVAKYLSNSLHIVVPGVGHGASGPCVRKLRRLFVEAGSLEGLDTSCIAEVPPTEFSVGD
jgi:pimeloyl-ACP methyl ester carboxylesterase